MSKTICTNCSTENLPSSKYCSACGHQLPKSDEAIIQENSFEPKSKTSNTTKKILGAVAGVVSFFLAYYGVQQLFFSKPTFNNTMMEVASELNKTCPIMVDSETRLDNAVALPNNVFQYNYTLINMDKAQVDTIQVKSYLEPVIKTQVKTNPQMKFQRDNKTTLNYYYKDKKGDYLFSITVAPKDYE